MFFPIWYLSYSLRLSLVSWSFARLSNYSRKFAELARNYFRNSRLATQSPRFIEIREGTRVLSSAIERSNVRSSAKSWRKKEFWSARVPTGWNVRSADCDRILPPFCSVCTRDYIRLRSLLSNRRLWNWIIENSCVTRFLRTAWISFLTRTFSVDEQRITRLTALYTIFCLVLLIFRHPPRRECRTADRSSPSSPEKKKRKRLELIFEKTNIEKGSHVWFFC